MSRRHIAVIALAAVFVVAMCHTKGSKRYYRASGVVWTTEYHLTYESGVRLDDSVQVVLETIDNCASKYNPASLLSRLNRNEESRLDSMLLRLYTTSAEVSRATAGAFDPTVSPLANVWGFGLDTDERPDSATIDSIMAFVGIGKTRLEGDRLIKSDNRLTFDFNSIAKGLACDEIGRMLARNGVENYIVEIGGEVAASGHSARGTKWRVSVDKPIESADTIIHESAFVVEIDHGGVATSGNYRNFRQIDGHKVGHIINPATGYPQSTDVLSATVIAPDCMTADAYATALMVLGLEAGKRVAQAQPSLSVALTYLDSRGEIATWRSPTLSQ